MSFTLSTSNLTNTSVSIVMTLTSDYSTSQSVSMSVQEGGSSGSTVYSTTVTILAGATTGDRIRTPISSLTASTTYYVATTISGGAIIEDLTFTTRDAGYDTVPKVATQGQWEDLADRVQSKAEIGTVLSPLNNVAYVDTDNIVDGAVTSSKIGFTTFIPQIADVEMDTGFEYGGVTVYAQRFTGSNISLTAYVRKDITLIASGIEDLIDVIGWVTPNTGSSAKGKIGTIYVAANGSIMNMSGGNYVAVTPAGALQFRIAFASNGSASYDMVIYYTKSS